MKRLTGILLAGVMMLGLAACGSSQLAANNENQTTEVVTDTETTTLQEEETNTAESTLSSDAEEPSQDGQSNVLVAYFAYSENMGDTSGMSVDAITSASVGPTDNTEGNLQIMAQVIQENTGADVFHIVVSDPYDPEYNVMLDRAVEEIENNTLPALTDSVENMEQYDVIYLGTPVWGGVLPQPVVTFLTENDLSRKTIIPFGIHLGSRFGRMLDQIEELCPEATLAEGFTISASTSNDDVRDEFGEWLADQEN